MVQCLFVDCSRRSDRKTPDKPKFSRVPAVVTNQGELWEELTRERRDRWIAAISRADLTENFWENDRVCDRHFESGRAAADWDKHNVDWVPSLNLGHKKFKEVDAKANLARAARLKEREKQTIEQQEREAEAKRQRVNESGEPIQQISFESRFVDADTQTEEFQYLFERGNTVAVDKLLFERGYFENDDAKVRFYTGLPSIAVLVSTFNHVAPHVRRQSKTLTRFQEFVMVLMKLRLNVPLQDLAYRFEIRSVSTVSRAFTAWIEAMDARLSPLISWPDRQSLWATMPQSFQFSFGKKTTVIIDCFEIFIDRPSNLLARAQTWSSYKHHNTIKVLIGISPQGTIAYTSEAWGGRTSDKYLTGNCGFLEKLLPGDMVMADRGFTIQENLLFRQANLVIPAFTKGKSQLDPVDVEKTRGIANVRIHVERVSGLLRRKYTILEGTLPIDFLITNPNFSAHDRVPLIDRIIRVCSAIVNLCPPIVPFD